MAEGCDVDALMEYLECPVCHEALKPPVTMCAVGHSVCSVCRPKLRHCPLCIGRLTESRNFIVERLVNLLTTPCAYQNYGCQRILPKTESKKHEMYGCGLRPYLCPVYTCGTSIPRAFLENHFARCIGEFKPVVVSRTKSEGAYGSYEYGLTFEVNAYDFLLRALKTPDWGLFVTCLWLRSDLWFCWVSTARCAEDSSHFSYEVTFTNETKKRLSFSDGVQSLHLKREEVVDSGHTFVVPPFSMTSMTDKAGLWNVTVSIKKHKDE